MNTPMQLLERWGFCPFCLAIKSYSTLVRVYYKNEPWESADGSICTNPVKLTAWLYSHITEDFERFTLDAYSYSFIPVAVIYDTPVCSIHLWSETESREARLRKW